MRKYLVPLAAATILSGVVTPVLAEDWPAGKVVQIVVPAPGGGGTGDTIARVLAEDLAKKLKTSVVIDNKPGANGNIGAAAAASSPPDGHRLLFSWAGTLAVNPSLLKNMPFDPQKSFTPIILLADVPNILVVNNDVPAKTLDEFIAYAKANPGKLNFGSTGNGSSMHLAGEFFMRETGTKMVHVPYNAPGTATTNLMANDIQLMFQLVPGIIGQIKGGKVRPIAVMATTRSPALPDVPTTAELGHPKLLSSTWFALLAPKGTPAPIIARINADMNEILRDPAVRKRLADMGASTLGGTPQQLADHLAAETTKWAAVVRDAGIKIQ
ncbi:MAG: tripartite tricarboxylate transporter substrate binding protein [Burkholderiales bacterium]|nr:tripartite tricarboxylate transporter substrate binding protein [Burkholderiales bacterium]